jgi:phage gpG-like protein
MQAGVLLVERAAKQNLSGRVLRVRTGRLRSSVTTAVSGSGTDLEGRVGTNVPYGAVHEFGARPHAIFPLRARRLRFQTGGRVVFSRRVQHPGAPPRPWLGPALQEQSQQIVDLFRSFLGTRLERGA